MVYAAIAVAVLLVGARWVRSGEAPAAADGAARSASRPTASSPAPTPTATSSSTSRAPSREPGVYRLPLGARVADAVQRAGGLARGAAEDGINLAARLSDGQQVVVPGRGAAAGAAAEGPISLGTATVDQLDEIEGIGPVTAQSIVEFRDENGGLHRSTSSTRSAASAPRRWRRCGPACSPERAPTRASSRRRRRPRSWCWLRCGLRRSTPAPCAASPAPPVEVRGAVQHDAEPGRSGHLLRARRRGGRVLVRAPEHVEAPIGSILEVRGRLAEPEPWRSGTLARHGIAMALEAERIEPTGDARGRARGPHRRDPLRAEAGLEPGMPEREQALARGFVLGQDDRIDAATREDFRRSGLAHLLAVSGQNVMLLCLLAWPFLALAG